MIAHDDLEELKCNICSKVFSSKYNLRRHVKTHTGEKPFSCLTCGRKFFHKHNLVRHQKVHSKTKYLKRSLVRKEGFSIQKTV